MAHYVVYDTVLKRPGCALLQATLGGDLGIAACFPTESWLLAPTERLRLYEVNDQELIFLIRVTAQKMRIERRAL